MKKFLCFVGGLCIGSALTYFLMEKKFKEDLDKEVEEIRDIYRRRTERSEHERDTVRAEASEPEERNEDHKGPVSHPSPTVSENYTHYREIASIYTPNDAPPPSESNGEIEYLTPNDFALSGRGEYDKVTLIYYEDDDTLADEFGDIVETPMQELLGPDILKRFGEYEEDVAYVRNPFVMTDYEVCLEHKAFGKAMYNDSPTDDE